MSVVLCSQIRFPHTVLDKERGGRALGREIPWVGAEAVVATSCGKVSPYPGPQVI